jgi:hypothetical protein
MRICSDGFIDVRDQRRVRTPGYFEDPTDPMPVAEALAFLLSHSFPGHRRIARSLNPRECGMLRRASWADSINERMSLVDQVWRVISRPVPPPANLQQPELVQLVRVDGWAYPLYLDGDETRVLPAGGLPMKEVAGAKGVPTLDFGEQKAIA